MILTAAQHITTVLQELEIQNVIEDRVYWELAEEDSIFPFVTFSITNIGPVSKDRFSEFEAKVRIFDKSLTAAATVSSVIRESVSNNYSHWRDKGAVSGYTDTEAKEAYIEITYNFKL
jgi:hypothetical protein